MLQEAFALVELIQDRRSFLDLVAQLARQTRVAVDTESNSLHAYRERVCLIQFSIPDRDYVLDVLALDDLSELGSIFASAELEKIFHAAEYDLICLKRDYGFSFLNIFDTMQAGRILGRKMAGLDRLLEEKFGVKVSKRLQKADWGARPLTEELISYAAQDTHYLIPLRDILADDLRAKGLMELAQEDFRMACLAPVNGEKARGESPAWSRLSGRRDLSPRELAILKELLDWREGTAEQLDRPPFKVISDERLIEIARAQPANSGELEATGLGERQRRLWGPEMLEAVARGLEQPPFHRQRRSMPSSAYLKRLDALKAWRKKAAAEMDVESDVVLPRGLLLELADGGPGQLERIMARSPWRLRRFGPEMAAVLQGSPQT